MKIPIQIRRQLQKYKLGFTSHHITITDNKLQWSIRWRGEVEWAWDGNYEAMKHNSLPQKPGWLFPNLFQIICFPQFYSKFQS